MNETQLSNKIFEQKEQLNSLISKYYELYSGMDTWYLWFNIASILIPLIILYFKIDKKRLFEISFFGYTAHLLWANIDSVLSANNYLVHPHTLTHLTPTGITITAVLFPVTFMLLYQYCTNKEKSFYIYAIIFSLIFAYGFGGFSKAVDLLKMHKGMNLTYLFLIDIAVAFTALWVTKLFRKFKDVGRNV
ncbi:CBO0543 family protein [Halobacillus seohaensis]|uniref:CBO0543 family protein n=1 Tax=Halobacillus seohaensis TaxID=447421 RepID=A0ABW2ENW3_9BACI